MATPKMAGAPAADDADLLTMEEAAERLRIGRTTMYDLVKRGAVESVTIGTLRRVPPEALKAYVADLLAERRRTADTA